MIILSNRFTPQQHGIISIIFGLVLLGYLLHIFEGFLFFVLLILALLMIASGALQSGLYDKIVQMAQKHKTTKD